MLGLVSAWECLCVQNVLMFVFTVDRRHAPIYPLAILVAEFNVSVSKVPLVTSQAHSHGDAFVSTFN